MLLCVLHKSDSQNNPDSESETEVMHSMQRLLAIQEHFQMSVKELILLLCDTDAAVTVSHRVDEAHARQDQQAGRALVAETLATSPAVMLKQQSAEMLHNICHIPSTSARTTVSHCTSDQLAISLAVAVMLQNICHIPSSSAGTSHSRYIRRTCQISGSGTGSSAAEHQPHPHYQCPNKSCMVHFWKWC